MGFPFHARMLEGVSVYTSAKTGREYHVYYDGDWTVDCKQQNIIIKTATRSDAMRLIELAELSG